MRRAEPQAEARSDDVEEGNKYARREASSRPKGLEGDWGAVCLLMLLYTLQGVPMGLSQSVPIILQSRHKEISLGQLAELAAVSLPFSLKIFWAPLVDSLYSPRFGRRKTWIIPAQLGIGLLLLWSGSRIEGWLAPAGGGAPMFGTLSRIFLLFYFLAATQDIAVDGLALTVLSEENKELGATCNAIGQTLGQVCGLGWAEREDPLSIALELETCVAVALAPHAPATLIAGDNVPCARRALISQFRQRVAPSGGRARLGRTADARWFHGLLGVSPKHRDSPDPRRPRPVVAPCGRALWPCLLLTPGAHARSPPLPSATFSSDRLFAC